MARKNGCKYVVAALPFIGRRVIMQLRDQKPGIDAPGCWSFFGGSIGHRETPHAAAARELFEEIGFNPKRLYRLGEERILDLDRIISVAYFCFLDIPAHLLRLTEGVDFGAKSLSEVRSGKIYSQKFNKFYPVVPSYYIEKTFRAALRCMDRL